jgi:hypothetical protein
MRQIATIYEEPKEAKPCLFARHDRSEGPVLGTLFLRGPRRGEGGDLIRPLASGRRRPQRRPALGACLGKERHVTTELSGIYECPESLPVP